MEVRIIQPRHLVGYGSFDVDEIVDLPKQVADLAMKQGWAVSNKKSNPKPTPKEESKSPTHPNFESLNNEGES